MCLVDYHPTLAIGKHNCFMEYIFILKNLKGKHFQHIKGMLKRQEQHTDCFRTGFLSLDTILWGHIILYGDEAVLCIGEYSAASLARTHQMAVAFTSLVTIRNVSRHCQMSSGSPHPSSWRTTAFHSQPDYPQAHPSLLLYSLLASLLLKSSLLCR